MLFSSEDGYRRNYEIMLNWTPGAYDWQSWSSSGWPSPECNMKIGLSVQWCSLEDLSCLGYEYPSFNILMSTCARDISELYIYNSRHVLLVFCKYIARQIVLCSLKKTGVQAMVI